MIRAKKGKPFHPTIRIIAMNANVGTLNHWM